MVLTLQLFDLKRIWNLLQAIPNITVSDIITILPSIICPLRQVLFSNTHLVCCNVVRLSHRSSIALNPLIK